MGIAGQKSDDLINTQDNPADTMPQNKSVSYQHEKVKSIMTKSPNKIPNSHQADEALKQEKKWICKVCQREGTSTTIRNHIEAHYLEGIVIPCNSCDKVLSSRNIFSAHKSRDHKNID